MSPWKMIITERASNFSLPFQLPILHTSRLVHLMGIYGKHPSGRAENHRLLPEITTVGTGKFHNYFVAVFDHDFEITHTWSDDWALK